MTVLRLRIALLLVLAGTGLAAQGAPAATVTVRATDDAWVAARAPARNRGTTPLLRVRAAPLKRTFLRFVVPALDGEVEKAVLRVYTVTGAPGGFRVFSTSAAWNERRITHRNAPAAGRLAGTLGGFRARTSWREIDVTRAVSGPGAKAFVVRTRGARADVLLRSKEGGRAPQLVITTADSGPSTQLPISTALPSVSGTAEAGRTLTATLGSWTGTAPISYARQWLRCNSSGGACANVNGATGASYVLAAADVGSRVRVRVTAANAAGQVSVQSQATGLVAATAPSPAPPPAPPPGTIITTDRPWNCTGALTAHGRLPIKVVSTIANAGAHDNDNAVSLRGCHGDGNNTTIDLILDIRGNRGSIGTSYDAVRVGQNTRDLQVTGNAECGARNGTTHQDIVQALSGSNITFVDFTSGNPQTGQWSCWGAGGGWYITWANGGRPTDLICLRCRLATYNQNLRIGDSLRSGARDSVFGYSRSYGIVVENVATNPVNANNQVIRY